ncbi:hypothetical protein BaRGS_00026813 [Batillaria attramentaria]|uniref:Uncharacterized protein n=1 Tax=Batillaria attramentaria TaxID=370345 RepID=A0ABD0K4Q8_9CAEN
MARCSWKLSWMIPVLSVLLGSSDGQYRQLDCQAGWYGDQCDRNCSDTCQPDDQGSRPCDKVTGRCFVGCVAGLWGDNCSRSCGQCAGDGSCDRMTAECLFGWDGTPCQEKVITRMKGLPQFDLAVVVGSVTSASVLVVAVVVVISICCYKRRLHKRAKSSDTELEMTTPDGCTTNHNQNVHVTGASSTQSLEVGVYEVVNVCENYETLKCCTEREGAENMYTKLTPGDMLKRPK